MALVGVQMAVAVPAVRDHDPGICGADERVELLAVAVLGDHKDRRAWRGGGPQRATLTARAPAGLIDMHHALVQHPVLQLQMRAGERLGGALADRIGRTGRERNAEQIARELTYATARDTVPGGQRHDGRRQPRPERAAADPVGQPGAGPRAAVRAAQLVRAMLAPDHADRRQLSDLMATEPPPRTPLLRRELAAAPTARLRIVIDDLVYLILGTQLATCTPVTRLTARLALPTLAAHQLLGLRAHLRPPLRTRLRRIRGRRLGTRARILTQLRL